MDVSYNIRAVLVSIPGIAVGLGIYHGLGSATWGGAAGCFTVAAGDIIWRIADRTNDDMMQAERGAMLYNLPLWLIGTSLGIAVLALGYLWPMMTSSDHDSSRPPSSLTMYKDKDMGESGQLGEIAVDHDSEPPTAGVAWWKPSVVLSKDGGSVELIDLATPPPTTQADAYAICESAFEAITHDVSAIVELEKQKPVFVVRPPDCDKLPAGTILECDEQSCRPTIDVKLH